MKLICIAFVAFFSIAINALTPTDYLQIMQENIEALYAARTIEQHQEAVNTFLRIVQAEPAKWHPLYYASFGYIMIATNTSAAADKDAYLDKAAELLRKAQELKPKESELTALEGFIDMIRLTVDPASRGAEYSGKAMQAFQLAIRQNPENPRAHFFLAQMQMGTAQFFGADVSEACQTLDKALALFESYEPQHPLDPVWGKEGAVQTKEACQK